MTTLTDSAYDVMWKAYIHWDKALNVHDHADHRSDAGQAAWQQWILENAGITIVDPNAWSGWKITDEKLFVVFMLKWS